MNLCEDKVMRKVVVGVATFMIIAIYTGVFTGSYYLVNFLIGVNISFSDFMVLNFITVGVVMTYKYLNDHILGEDCGEHKKTKKETNE